MRRFLKVAQNSEFSKIIIFYFIFMYAECTIALTKIRQLLHIIYLMLNGLNRFAFDKIEKAL